MPLESISKGTGPNTGTGTPAETAADIINNNFDYLKGLIDAITVIKIGSYTVEKASGNTDLINFEVGDEFSGWIETKTRYVVGVVIALPFDVNDKTKVGLAVNNYI